MHGKYSRSFALSISLALVLLAFAPSQTSGATAQRQDEPDYAASHVATFNVLGDSHTRKGKKKSMGTGVERMGRTVKIIDQRGFDLVGFQEMQRVQVQEFLRLRTTDWGIYPGLVLRAQDGENTIAWKRSVWTLVSVATQTIPYFDGKTREMPILLLQHNASGQQVYVMNVHNPSTDKKNGNHDKWRQLAMDLQIAKIRELRSTTKLPLILTGDMNEREEAFCQFGQLGKLRAANGVGVATLKRGCTPPPSMQIDWIFGTKDIVFTDYKVWDTPRIQRTTDHPVVAATAMFPVPKQFRQRYLNR